MEPFGLMRIVPELPAVATDHAVVVLFTKSSSKHYQSAISIARAAPVFVEHVIDGQPYHVAAFARDPKQFTLAGILIDYVASWKTTIIVCMGRRLLNSYRFSELAACINGAAGCADSKAHCCEVIKRAFMEDSYGPASGFGLTIRIRMPGEVPLHNDEPPPIPAYVSPCKRIRLYGRLSRHHPSSPADQIDALAKEDFIDACPYFNPSLFREIEDASQWLRS